MGVISPIYGSKEPLRMKKPRRQRPISTDKLRHMERLASAKARLVALVRANGFPECRSDCRIDKLRKYLKERKLTP